MKHFLADEWDKARAQKRGGGVPLVPLQFDTAETRYGLEPADNDHAGAGFERRWALTLLEDVLNRLRAEYEQDGKAELFAALKPCLVGDRTSQPYAELAAKLGMSEGAVKSAVHRLRQRYRAIAAGRDRPNRRRPGRGGRGVAPFVCRAGGRAAVKR